MAAKPKKGGLGRGLDALFADVPVTAPQPEEIKEEKAVKAVKEEILAEEKANG